MNYVGLKIETMKKIEAGRTKQEIINFVESKWESQPFSFSKRIDSMQKLILEIKRVAIESTPAKFKQNLIITIDRFKK